MALMEDCLLILRRRIGDTEEPFTFADSLLVGYIEDAVNQVELDYPHGYIVEFEEFTPEPGKKETALFAIKAHYLVKLRTKDKADRDNFVMRKGRLTLDNTNQAKDHADTLAEIKQEYNNALFKVRNGAGTIHGIRLE